MSQLNCINVANMVRNFLKKKDSVKDTTKPHGDCERVMFELHDDTEYVTVVKIERRLILRAS